MTTTELTITDLLLRLDEAARVESELKATIDERRAAVEVEIAGEVDQLAANRATKESIRAEIYEAMIANGGGVYNDSATGHTASLRTTNRTVIADPDKVKQSLAALGELDACMKLDDRAVFEIAKHRSIEGLETIGTLGLVIK